MYKRIITIIVIAILPLMSFAQTSIFDKFEDMDDVSTVVVTSEAFRMLGKVGGGSEEAKEYAEMLKGLNELKVFSTENKAIATQMNATFKSYLSKNSLTELMRIKDKDANVRIYVKKGKNEDFVDELLMFVSDIDKGTSNSVLLSLTGTIDLNKISELTEKMNISGGEYLKSKK